MVKIKDYFQFWITIRQHFHFSFISFSLSPFLGWGRFLSLCYNCNCKRTTTEATCTTQPEMIMLAQWHQNTAFRLSHQLPTPPTMTHLPKWPPEPTLTRDPALFHIQTRLPFHYLLSMIFGCKQYT